MVLPPSILSVWSGTSLTVVPPPGSSHGSEGPGYRDKGIPPKKEGVSSQLSSSLKPKGWRGISASVPQIYRRFLKFAYIDVRVCTGKCLLTSCERVIQKKTLNPFDVSTIRLDTLLQHNNSKNINTTNWTAWKLELDWLNWMTDSKGLCWTSLNIGLYSSVVVMLDLCGSSANTENLPRIHSRPANRLKETVHSSPCCKSSQTYKDNGWSNF